MTISWVKALAKAWAEQAVERLDVVHVRDGVADIVLGSRVVRVRGLYGRREAAARAITDAVDQLLHVGRYEPRLGVATVDDVLEGLGRGL